MKRVFDWKAYLKDSFGYEIDDSWMDEDTESDEDMEDSDISDILNAAEAEPEDENI